MNQHNTNFHIDQREPLLASPSFPDTKDPCPVFDGQQYHIFGSGGTSEGQIWNILHATAPRPEGPWTEREPADLGNIAGPHVCAPGVIYDEGLLHMFVQRDCFGGGGGIEYLTSSDGGKHFDHFNTALNAVPDGHEWGIYDAHPALLTYNGVKHYFLTYSGFADPKVTPHRNDIYLAESSGWAGPWRRLTRIVAQESIEHHNQPGQDGYEWGLEGAQLYGLPNGKTLLVAVCFLPNAPEGKRQRVFFAFADQPTGPYRSLGPILPRRSRSGKFDEDGHAALLVNPPSVDKLLLYYQERRDNPQWRYGLAKIPLQYILGRINAAEQIEAPLLPR